jgi:hypothetical protein
MAADHEGTDGARCGGERTHEDALKAQGVRHLRIQYCVAAKHGNARQSGGTERRSHVAFICMLLAESGARIRQHTMSA